MIFVVPGDLDAARVKQAQEVGILTREIWQAARGALTMREAAQQARERYAEE